MTNSFVASLTLAATPTDMRSVGIFGDSLGSGGYKVVGDVFQKLLGRHSTIAAVTSTAVYTCQNTDNISVKYDTVVGSDSLGAFDVNTPNFFYAPYAGYYRMNMGFRKASLSEEDPRCFVVVNSVDRPGCGDRRYMRGGFTLSTNVFTAAAGDEIQVLCFDTTDFTMETSGGLNIWAELRLIERTS